jgi:hypothetical protein
MTRHRLPNPVYETSNRFDKPHSDTQEKLKA